MVWIGREIVNSKSFPNLKEKHTHKSSPDWPLLDWFARAIAILTNPQAHFWPSDQGGESGAYTATPEPERKAAIETIKDEMQKVIDTPVKPEDAAGRN